MSFISRRKGAIIGAAIAVPALVFAGISFASASIPDASGAVHACYKTPVSASGAKPVIIDTDNGGCPSGNTEVQLLTPGSLTPGVGLVASTHFFSTVLTGPDANGKYIGDFQVNCPESSPNIINGGVVALTGADNNGEQIACSHPFWANPYPDQPTLLVGGWDVSIISSSPDDGSLNFIKVFYSCSK